MSPAPRTTRGERVPSARRRRGAPSAPVESGGTPAGVLSQLTDLIPAEAVALYVAILPFTVPKDVPLDHQDFTSRWVLAIGVAIAAVLFGVGVYRRGVIDRGGTFRWPIRRTATVLLAYAGWVFAIPASPLNSFEWYTGSVGAVVGIAATAVIALMHLWLGPPED